MESIMEHVAKAVNKHPIWVKELNLYQKNQVRQQKPSQGAIPVWEKQNQQASHLGLGVQPA